MFRKVAVISVALAMLAAMPGGILARSDHATLINVHVTHARPGTATANCSNDPGTDNGDYELTGWKVGGNKTAHLNLSAVPSGIAGGVVTQLRNSFNAWSAVSGVPTIGVDSNGTVSKATANHSYDLMWGRTGGSSIAVTYTWQWSNGEIESDTVFNNRLPWFIANPDEADHCLATAAYDVANIATHEFGHTYGLGHAANDRWETMYPYGFTGETAKRSLGDGDTDGVFDVYH